MEPSHPRADPGETPVRVTAIVQSFNHEAYLQRALDSVVSQRGVGSYEVLIGDDASTDGSREIIEAYARRYPDLIRTFLPDANMGGAGKELFAELVRRSRGDYIAMLDADDYWTSDDKCRIQADHLDRNPGCSMVFHNVMIRYERGEHADFPYNPPDQARRLGRTDLYPHNPAAACSPMFRREAIDPLPSWYFESPLGDWPLYFCAAEAGEIHYLPEMLGVYWIHDAGAFSGLRQLDRLTQEIGFFQALPAGATPADRFLHAQRLGQGLAWMAYERLRLGEFAEARAALLASRSRWPMRPAQLLGTRGARRRIVIAALLVSPRFAQALLLARKRVVTSRRERTPPRTRGKLLRSRRP
jgi:hypothetical protein